MKKSKLILPILTFILAISTAFVSGRFILETGHSRAEDVPSQIKSCQNRNLLCSSNGNIICTVIIDGEVIDLYDSTCESLLFTRIE